MFLVAFTAYAKVEPLQVTHARFFYSGTLVNGTIYGTMDVVGVLDRQDASGTYTQNTAGNIQYRAFGTSGWTDVTVSSDISLSSWAGNYRRLNARLPATVVELRVCRPDEGCSAPYGFRYLPLFDFIYGDTTVTPFDRTLRFEIQNVQSGGLRFTIGKLNEMIADMSYSAVTDASIVSCVPRVPGYDESICEVSIPGSVLTNPGTYDLMAVTNTGASQNKLRFTATSVFKIISTVPERIRSHLHDVLTFNFAAGAFNPQQIDVSIISGQCRFQRLPVTGPGKDFVEVRIPPPCFPQGGVGDLTFDVRTPEGRQILKVPYDL